MKSSSFLPPKEIMNIRFHGIRVLLWFISFKEGSARLYDYIFMYCMYTCNYSMTSGCMSCVWEMYEKRPENLTEALWQQIYRDKWKTSGWVWEIVPSADTIEGREISTAWPIIWSNGGPSVRNKSPQLFCISSSDDRLTFVPRRWSQLKAPSVKRLWLPDAEPHWEIYLTYQFTVMGVFLSAFIF